MLFKKISKARKAFHERDALASIRAHKSLDGTEEHNTEGQYIKSFVYGGLDGIITTFAVVAGVAGASLSSSVVLILGFANLVADGLSMAIGDYLSTKAENEYNRSEREREEWEVENYPEGERQEVIDVYRSKGLNLEDATTIADILTKHKNAWVDLMMVEELGLFNARVSPVKNAFVTFFSFSLFGCIPLAFYVIALFIPELDNMFYYTVILTAITLFILGLVKGRVTRISVLKSGAEMLLVGGIAALAAFGIGHLLAGLVE